MLESGRMAPGESRHIDRCLSCLACQTACPSGVDYQHLVDLARVRIERDVPRPLADRVLRGGLDAVLTRPGLFRLAALAGIALRRAAGLFRLRWPGAVGRTLGLLPGVLPPPSPVDRPASYFATKPAGGFAGNGPRRRVMLLPGCVQTVLAPSINEA
ncbi:MAG: glycolate oxidase iron-sulfur subunit, partial [Alphaproteobacteria bacterium]